MLTAEDRELLGMPSKSHKARRPTAVSQILRAGSDDLERGPAEWDVHGDSEDQPGYHMVVASDRKTRRRAYALAHRVYHGRGYVSGDVGLMLSPYDAHPLTLTLLAVDENGRDAATVSLVFDSAGGLPCDAIYNEELSTLRRQGRRMVEVTRLAIDAGHQRSRMLLVHLFNFIYIFAYQVRGFDDFVIEVTPRHVNYYRRLLLFELLGSERPCPRVQGAPAVLLRLNLGMIGREVLRAGNEKAAANHRTLYPYFYSWLQTGAVAEFLACSHKPMSAEDARYFGLEPLAAACRAL